MIFYFEFEYVLCVVVCVVCIGGGYGCVCCVVGVC